MPEQPFEPPYRPFLYIPRTADDIGEVRPQLAPGQSPRDHGLVWLRGGIPWPMDTVFPDQHVSPRVLVRNGSIAPSSACIVQIRLYRKEEAGLIMKANFRDVAMEVGPGLRVKWSVRTGIIQAEQVYMSIAGCSWLPPSIPSQTPLVRIRWTGGWIDTSGQERSPRGLTRLSLYR